MVNIDKARMYAMQGRYAINLPSKFVKDAEFPFGVKEDLIVRIDEGKVVIEKAGMRTVINGVLFNLTVPDL